MNIVEKPIAVRSNKIGWYAKEEDRKDNKRRRGEERLLIDVLNDKA